VGQILKSEIDFFTMSKREEIITKNVIKGKINYKNTKLSLSFQTFEKLNRFFYKEQKRRN
jgi:hypothetical protein